MRNFHRPGGEKRMIVILPPDRHNDWLSAPAAGATEFLRLYPAELLVAEPRSIQPKEQKMANHLRKLALTVDETEDRQFFWAILEATRATIYREQVAAAETYFDTYLGALEAGYAALAAIAQENPKRGPRTNVRVENPESEVTWLITDLIADADEDGEHASLIVTGQKFQGDTATASHERREYFYRVNDTQSIADLILQAGELLPPVSRPTDAALN
jgi:hypothetical protein